MDKFPAFQVNFMYIEEHKILEEMTNKVMKVVIFDCYYSSTSSTSMSTTSKTTWKFGDNYSTLFDFKGVMMISATKHNQFPSRQTHGTDMNGVKIFKFPRFKSYSFFDRDLPAPVS